MENKMEKPFNNSHYSTTKPRIPFDLLNHKDLLGNKINAGMSYPKGDKPKNNESVENTGKNTHIVVHQSFLHMFYYYRVNVKGNIVFVIYCRNDLSSHNQLDVYNLPIRECSECNMTTGKLYLIDIPIHHLSKFSEELFEKFEGYYNLVKFTVNDLFTYHVYSSADFYNFLEYAEKPFAYLKNLPTMNPVNLIILNSYMNNQKNNVFELQSIFNTYGIMYSDRHKHLRALYNENFSHNTRKNYKCLEKWEPTMDTLSKFEFSITTDQLKTAWNNRYTDQIDF